MKLEPKRTALLTLDLQLGIFGMVPGTETILPAASRAVEFARRKNLFLIHVGLGFAEGHPEISIGKSRFAMVKEKNLFVKGSPTAQFHPAIYRDGERTVYKQRVGAFTENELHLILRAQNIDTLIMFGLSTSGIVLSTLRRAVDLDYQCIVLKDACLDQDEDVHRVLIEKVFAAQATVMTTDAFISEWSE